MRTRAVVIALAVAAAACARQEPKAAAAAPRPNWLLEVPIISQSSLVDTTGTPEAQHIVIVTAHPMDSVAAFYRSRLIAQGWQVMGEEADTASMSLYLQRGGAPMWIQLEAQGPRTRASFIASGAAKPGKPAPEGAPR
jgi:hypothetical protein